MRLQKISSKELKRPVSPNKDKIVFIKTQLKSNTPNFSRVILGEDGVNILVEQLKANIGKKYKEIKFSLIAF